MCNTQCLCQASVADFRQGFRKALPKVFAAIVVFIKHVNQLIFDANNCTCDLVKIYAPGASLHFLVLFTTLYYYPDFRKYTNVKTTFIQLFHNFFFFFGARYFKNLIGKSISQVHGLSFLYGS